jgi:hypothetical protein
MEEDWKRYLVPDNFLTFEEEAEADSMPSLAGDQQTLPPSANIDIATAPYLAQQDGAPAPERGFATTDLDHTDVNLGYLSKTPWFSQTPPVDGPRANGGQPLAPPLLEPKANCAQRYKHTLALITL